MLRTVVIYESDGREMPIIETREPSVARCVAEIALGEYEEGQAFCTDPVLAEIIGGEVAQVRRVLRAMGLRVGGPKEG